MTIVALRIYFNAKGRAKIAIALGTWQEAARQARDRESARLESRQVEVDARAGLGNRRRRGATLSSRPWLPSRRRLQRLVEVGENVIDMLDADRQPDVIRP